MFTNSSRKRSCSDTGFWGLARIEYPMKIARISPDYTEILQSAPPLIGPHASQSAGLRVVQGRLVKLGEHGDGARSAQRRDTRRSGGRVIGSYNLGGRVRCGAAACPYRPSQAEPVAWEAACTRLPSPLWCAFTAAIPQARPERL